MSKSSLNQDINLIIILQGKTLSTLFSVLVFIQISSFSLTLYLNGTGLGGGGNLHMLRYGDVPLFWVRFWGCSQIFGYLFELFPDFWVSSFWLFLDFWVSFFGKI